jgi:heme exporter protein D
VGDFDSSAWQALGLTLTVLGLALSVVMWRRRGAASGLRGVAWSLLPLAAAMTGTLRLVWEVADSVVDWALRLVFSPVVWLGIVLAGVSVVLFVVSGMLRRRSPRRAGTPEKEQRSEVTDRSSRPPASAGPDDDMDDIEAILKKHGIS